MVLQQQEVSDQVTGKTDLQSSYKSFHLPECLRQTKGRSALQHLCALQPHIQESQVLYI